MIDLERIYRDVAAAYDVPLHEVKLAVHAARTTRPQLAEGPALREQAEVFERRFRTRHAVMVLRPIGPGSPQLDWEDERGQQDGLAWGVRCRGRAGFVAIYDSVTLANDLRNNLNAPRVLLDFAGIPLESS